MVAGGDHWAGGNGIWSTAGQWNGGVPGAASDAVLDASGNYTVLMNAPTTVGSIEVVSGQRQRCVTSGFLGRLRLGWDRRFGCLGGAGGAFLASANLDHLASLLVSSLEDLVE